MKTKSPAILSSISKISIATALVAGTAIFGACADNSGAHYIDPHGRDTVVSLNKVDIQDFQMAADSLVASMMQFDVFAGEKKPIIALSTVTNDTTNNFDVALITSKIQQAILRSRLATVSRAMSADAGTDVVRQNASALGATTTEVPDLSLTGKIHEVYTGAGKVRQTSYVFQMQLAEVKTGNIIWMEEKTITKQGEHNAVGW